MTHDDQPNADDPQRPETHHQKEPLPGGPEANGEPPSGPAGRPTETRSADAPVRTPRQIGRFHVKGVIASGGMGTVYEAVQEHPRRAVALKVMKHGIASRSALRRFEYESQILARLHHPGIAQVYEAGTHDDGTGPVPYFAMEYIPNAKPITQYAKEKKVGTRERLELFAHVCDAVHHGHQKGVIHRDLKPGNVLVDSHGEVKIIDFGVARGTDSDLAVTTVQTDIGQLIGTLQYMSPEQCEADPHDIDTRSDVYALGVVLYELLSGKPPYDVVHKPVYESTRVIREQQPTRLSTVDSALKGDTETIVFKALEKDRERRYQSATELAQDIRRYLAGEAIIARPPSIVYQFRVFARRNKALFGATAAVFVVLLAGVIVSTSLYFRAEDARIAESRQRKLAEAARDEADRARGAEKEQRKLAEANATKAQQETAKAKAVNAFLHEMLASVDPIRFGVSSGPGRDGSGMVVGVDLPARDAKVADLLIQATQKVEQALADQPELEAQVRDTMGMTFQGLGMFEHAEPQLVKALEIRRRLFGDKHLETFRAQANLGTMYLFQLNVVQADPLLRSAAEGLEQLLGEEHPDTLSAKQYIGLSLALRGNQKGVEPLREALEVRRRVLGEEHRSTVETMVWLSFALSQRGDVLEAESMARRALGISRRVLGPNDWYTSASAGFLGWALHFQGRNAEAEPLLREAEAQYRRTLGNTHPYTGFAVSQLAGLLGNTGKLNEQAELCRDFLEGVRGTVGEENPLTTLVREELLVALKSLGRLEEARAVTAEMIEGHRRKAEQPGADADALNTHAWALLTCEPADLRDPEAALPAAKRAVELSGGQNPAMLDTLALAHARTGDLDQAIETQRRAMAMLSPNDMQLLVPLSTRYLILLLHAGRTAEADQFLSVSLAALRGQLGEANPQLAVMVNKLGVELGNEGLHAQALLLFREALELNRKFLGNEHKQVAVNLGNLAWSHSELGDHSSAVAARREALAVQRKLHRNESSQVAGALNMLGVAVAWSGDLAAAAEAFRETLEIHRELGGEDSPDTAMAKRNLAGTLVELGQLGEAEQLAREALAHFRRVHGDRYLNTAGVMRVLGLVLVKKGQAEQAESILRDCVDALRSLSLPEADAWRLARAESTLGECLTALQRFDEAEPVLVGAYEALLGAKGEAFAATVTALQRVITLYDAWGKPEQAAEWRAKLPPTQPATAPTEQEP